MVDNIIVAVISSPGNTENRRAIRETWASKFVPGIRVLFVVGVDIDGDIPELRGDTVFIPMKESYDKLPIKTRGICNWALNNCKYDYIFKCDDDTYVDLNKLKNFDPQSKDYIGSECRPGVASGGAGYLMSYLATMIVSDTMLVATGSEDVEVAKSLYNNSTIRLHNSAMFDAAHYARNHKIPLPDNDQITTHYVSPVMMRDIFSRNRSNG